MNNSGAIKRMCEQDLEQVIALEQACGLSSRGLEKYRQDLPDQNNIFLTIKDHDGRIIGFFSGRIVVDELQIDNFAVEESQRGRGLGSGLLRLALSEASRRGALRATLEMRAANGAAAALYARFGFIIVGRRRNYYQRPVDDALLMDCDLKTCVLPENVS